MLEALMGGLCAAGSAAQWSPGAGIRVWAFHCARFPAPASVEKRAGVLEVLFCREGTLLLDAAPGRSTSVSRGEILLLGADALFSSFRCTEQPFCGVLVCVDTPPDGRPSVFPQLLPRPDRLNGLLRQQGSRSALRTCLWSDAAFSALNSLPPQEQFRYCLLKTVELLYLMECGSPLLSWNTSPSYCDPYQVSIVQQVHDYMLDHLEEPLTIQELARRFRLSPTGLKECFRRQYGQPIHSYLKQCRLRRAAQLLTSTSLSVVQIALAVGYGSVSQFGVAFKEQYHVPPSHYRRQQQKNV